MLASCLYSQLATKYHGWCTHSRWQDQSKHNQENTKIVVCKIKFRITLICVDVSFCFIYRYTHIQLRSSLVFTQRRSLSAKSVGCFRRRLFVCVWLFVNTITSERVNIGWWNLEDRCTVQKLRPSSKLEVIAPGWASLKNVALGYDAGKISAWCLVVFPNVLCSFKRLNQCTTAGTDWQSIR